MPETEGVRFEMFAYPDVPGVRSILVDADERLWCAVKESYGVSLVLRGHSEWRSRGGAVTSGPGAIQVSEPGTVHKDLRRDGPARFQIITLEVSVVRACAERRGIRRLGSLRAERIPPRHPDRRAFLALMAAYRAPGDALTRQTVVAEALDALVRQMGGGPEPASASMARVRRAVEYIHANLTGAITLDEVAAAAGIDRFHLCRAFRAELGVPPYAYVLRARIARARSMLAEGARTSDVATLLGFCDQSQLHRHFRRATGLTPGAYAKIAGTVACINRRADRSPAPAPR